MMARLLPFALTPLAVLALPIASAAAQRGVWRADSLLAAGRLSVAESAYFAAVREDPRDPRARAALGRFLAARGSVIAGIVLLEEARDFGGDSAVIARSLAPMYAWERDYSRLLGLRPAVLSAAQRRQAQWLADHVPASSLPDSVALVTYHAATDGIGLVAIRVGRDTMTATIDPAVPGLQLPAPTPELRSFGADGQLTLAVAPVVRIGVVTLANVPVTIGNTDVARIGFAVLARLRPTFDPARGMLLLRREIPPHTRVAVVPGTHVPALLDTNGLRLLFGGQWNSSSGEAASLLLTTRAWTWDVKRGDVVLIAP